MNVYVDLGHGLKLLPVLDACTYGPDVAAGLTEPIIVLRTYKEAAVPRYSVTRMQRARKQAAAKGRAVIAAKRLLKRKV